VFSDFRMARVGSIQCGGNAPVSRELMNIVSFPNECTRGQHSGREEGELVMRYHHGPLWCDQALRVKGEALL